MKLNIKQAKEALEAFTATANHAGIVDLREAAYLSGYSDVDLLELAKRIGFRFVSQWKINTKIIDV